MAPTADWRAKIGEQAHADPDHRNDVIPRPIHKTPYGGTTLHLVQREDDRASQLRQT